VLFPTTSSLYISFMHILAISTTFVPLSGGSETHCRNLYSAMVAAGHRVTLITHASSPELPSAEWIDGIEVLRTRSFVKKIDTPYTVAWEEAIFGALQDIHKLLGVERTFDIIHTQNQAALLLGSFMKGALRCPLVASFHETCPELDAFGTQRSEVLISCMPVDAFIVGSRFFYRQVERFGGTADQIHLVYGGVDLQSPTVCPIDRAELRRLFGIPVSAFTFICIARFKQRKRQLELLDAFFNAVRLNANLHLVLAGSCNSASLEYYKRVSKKSASCPVVDTISVRRDLSDDELSKLISISDAGILVSKSEGLGLALIEMMSRGIPVQ